MKKLFSLLILVAIVATLPMLATAKQQPAVEVVGDTAPAGPAVPAGKAPQPIPEALLYDNGPMITHPGGGFNGADASAVQTALAMTLYGFGHQLLAGNRMADGFAIADPGGWDLDSIQFFAYQTGTYGFPPASTITAVNYRIWDAAPPGGSVICGDNTTNMISATTWSGIYRVLDTGLTNSQRPMMESTVSIWPACAHLDPGTYWLDWQSDGSLASGPWAPPITILGQTVTGDGLQSVTDNGVTWAAAMDTGAQQGLPFRIFGTIAGGNTLYVSDIHLRVAPRGFGKYAVRGQIEISSAPGVVEPGATVFADWTLPDTTVVSQSNITRAGSGEAAFKVNGYQTGTFQLCVTDVVKAGWTYDPNQNVETCVSITVP
jgi:hypothetical protein